MSPLGTFTNHADDAPLLSIIVPVYNVAPYLRQCLDCLTAQTLPKKYFEVLLIDDGSTDGSLDICLDYAEHYANFKVVALQEHTLGGCGIPSNIGIRNARGTYVGFMDGDDYAHPEMFEELLRSALTHGADVSLCDHSRHDMEKNAVLAGPDTDKFKILDSPAFSTLPENEKKIMYLNLNTPPWLKICRSSMLRESGTAFPEGEFFFEDIVFHWQCLLAASRIVHVSKKLITHRIGRPGQTIAAFGCDLLGVLPNLQRLKTFLLQNGCYARYRLAFLRCAAGRYAWVLPRLDRNMRRKFFREACGIEQDFSCMDIPSYCRTNRLRLRTGVKHYLSMHGCRNLARLLPVFVDAAVTIYVRLRSKSDIFKIFPNRKGTENVGICSKYRTPV
jgi:glycosyltransferase involved in cell wall biosynthesis